MREPSEIRYPDRRQFLKTLGGGALALSLCSIVRARDADSKVDSIDNLKKQIVAFAAHLGSEDFKKRRKATSELIRIGKGFGKDKKVDAEAKELVLAEMAKLKDHKDPEVAQRAKNIIVALTPKPKPPRTPIIMKGEMVAPVIEVE